MTYDDVERGKQLIDSGKYTPTADSDGQTDDIPLPPEPAEPADPGPSDDSRPTARRPSPPRC